MLTRQFVSILCRRPRDEYTSDRSYYKVDAGLTDIRTDIPKDVLEVSLSDNMIRNITANSFSGLSECVILNFQRNRISEVEPGAFNGLGI